MCLAAGPGGAGPGGLGVRPGRSRGAALSVSGCGPGGLGVRPGRSRGAARAVSDPPHERHRGQRRSELGASFLGPFRSGPHRASPHFREKCDSGTGGAGRCFRTTQLLGAVSGFCPNPALGVRAACPAPVVLSPDWLSSDRRLGGYVRNRLGARRDRYFDRVLRGDPVLVGGRCAAGDRIPVAGQVGRIASCPVHLQGASPCGSLGRGGRDTTWRGSRGLSLRPWRNRCGGLSPRGRTSRTRVHSRSGHVLLSATRSARLMYLELVQTVFTSFPSVTTSSKSESPRTCRTRATGNGANPGIWQVSPGSV